MVKIIVKNMNRNKGNVFFITQNLVETYGSNIYSGLNNTFYCSFSYRRCQEGETERYEDRDKEGEEVWGCIENFKMVLFPETHSS
jgi:hypothetical protein